jgi:hypothetical protein
MGALALEWGQPNALNLREKLSNFDDMAGPKQFVEVTLELWTCITL